MEQPSSSILFIYGFVHYSLEINRCTCSICILIVLHVVCRAVEGGNSMFVLCALLHIINKWYELIFGLSILIRQLQFTWYQLGMHLGK